MTMRIEIKDEITLFNGTFQGEPIYYMVAYNNCSPRVIILNKNKFDLLLRKRETICVTTFSDRNFEPQQKTKARHVNYY